MAFLKDSRREKDTILEGKAQEFAIESERKMMSKINALQGRIQDINDQISAIKIGPETTQLRKIPVTEEPLNSQANNEEEPKGETA